MGNLPAERVERVEPDLVRDLVHERHDELTAVEIAASCDITSTAVSQHLTVLKNAGRLSERRDGTRRLYRARPEGLAGLRELLDDMWSGALDAARSIAEEERGVAGDDRAASA